MLFESAFCAMLNTLLIYFLGALIALQSVVFAANTHPLQSTDHEHTSVDHQHDHQHLPTALEDNNDHFLSSDNTGDADCDHCCHCHGHLTPALIDGADNITMRQHVSLLSPYPNNVTTDVINSLLRPPIV